MKIASVQIMRNIDNYCINELGIPGIVLMENAALKVVKNIDFQKYKSFCIVCSKGNNGGDGFAVCRYLYNLGKNIKVFLVGNEEGMSHDCKINYTILKNLGISINKINGLKELQELKNCLKISDATIDAIFGTGLSRDVEGIYSDVISCINDNANYIFSIDIPSGLSGNTGNVLKNCIRADKTISFQLFKRGFMKYGVDSFIGDLIIEDIGIPKSVIEKFNIQEFLMDKYYIKSKLKERNIYAHKGDFGRTLVIAGSAGFSGAAYISTQSAVKSGSGLVTLACSKDIQNIMSEKLTEAMTVKLEEFDKVEKLIKNADSIAIGPGMGNNETTLKILKNTIENSKSTVVIDADGINVLKDNLSILKNKSCRIIMTPHLGEMSRITGLSIDYIKENRIEVSKEFAKKNNVIIVLKGYNTVITDGWKVAINSTGNSSMASGGMGDCLTGIIASFLSQKYEDFDAACISVYLHGLCGDRLSKDMFCVSASDIIKEIPYAIKDLLI